MQKVKCITEEYVEFTFGKIYDVDRVDSAGDIWVIADDGHPFFFYPSEVEFVE